MTRVCIIGLWHLGLVHAVGFARAKVSVVGLEFDESFIRKLRKGILSLYEPGLSEELKKGLQKGRIVLRSNASDVSAVDYIIITYDTPVNKDGGVRIDPIFDAVKQIAIFIAPQTPVVITSQVPLGTSQKIEQMIHSRNPSWKSGVVYIPENIKLGQALERFKTPDMLIFGSDHKTALRDVMKLYHWIRTKRRVMGLSEAEMVKHTINAFLATSISYANEIAGLCDHLGIDAVKVLSAVQMDKRIGKVPIAPGLGFSGATILRDVVALRNYAKKSRYKADLLRSVYALNKGTFHHVSELVSRQLGSMKGKTIGFLGLTYKPGTSTMRHSPTVVLAKEFVSKGAKCRAYDPLASETETNHYRKNIIRMKNPMDLARESDVLLLVTPWPEFKTLQYDKLARHMKKPVLIDTKNFLDPVKVKRAGFTYIGYGR